MPLSQCSIIGSGLSFDLYGKTFRRHAGLTDNRTSLIIGLELVHCPLKSQREGNEDLVYVSLWNHYFFIWRGRIASQEFKCITMNINNDGHNGVK